VLALYGAPLNPKALAVDLAELARESYNSEFGRFYNFAQKVADLARNFDPDVDVGDEAWEVPLFPPSEDDCDLFATMACNRIKHDVIQKHRAFKVAKTLSAMLIEEFPENYETKELRGSFLVDDKKYAEAIEMLSSLVTDERIPSPQALYNLGFCYLNKNKPAEAETMLRASLDGRNPENYEMIALTKTKIVNALFKQKKTKDAAMLLRDVWEEFGTDYAMQAVKESYGLGDYQTARFSAKVLKELDANNGTVDYYYVESCRKLMLFEEAIEYYQNHVNTNQPLPEKTLLGKMFYQAAAFQKESENKSRFLQNSRSFFSEAWDIVSQYDENFVIGAKRTKAQLRAYMGLTMLEENNEEYAQDEFENALALDIDCPHAHWGMARICLQNKQWEDAQEWLDSARRSGSYRALSSPFGGYNPHSEEYDIACRANMMIGALDGAFYKDIAGNKDDLQGGFRGGHNQAFMDFPFNPG
jgi:Tfp pilus assembly protein PilF